MKKNKLTVLQIFILLISVLTLITNCTNKEVETQIEKSLIFDELNLNFNKSTSIVSSIFFNAGVTNLNVNKENSKMNINAKTGKDFILNGKKINLSDFSIRIEKNEIILNQNENYRIGFLEGKPYLKTTNFNGYLSEYNKDIRKNELSILLLYFNEITQNRVTLVNTEAIIHKTLPSKQACSFWNTYYVYSFGGNQSVSEANVDQEAAYEIVTGELGGCSRIGGINTSCAWGQHMCLSSQAVCCN